MILSGLEYSLTMSTRTRVRLVAGIGLLLLSVAIGLWLAGHRVTHGLGGPPSRASGETPRQPAPEAVAADAPAPAKEHSPRPSEAGAPSTEPGASHQVVWTGHVLRSRRRPGALPPAWDPPVPAGSVEVWLRRELPPIAGDSITRYVRQASARTDAGGLFRFVIRVPGLYDAWVADADCTPAEVSCRHVRISPGGPTAASATLELKESPPPPTVAGLVVWRSTQAPVPGVLVVDAVSRMSASTGAEGRFVLGPLPGGESARGLLLAVPGLGSVAHTVPDAFVPVRIELDGAPDPGAAMVHGQVVDIDGKACPGVQVTLQPEFPATRESVRGMTDSEGRVRFQRVEPGWYGADCESVLVLGSTARIDARAGRESEFRVWADPKPLTIRVAVRTEDGSPIPPGTRWSTSLTAHGRVGQFSGGGRGGVVDAGGSGEFLVRATALGQVFIWVDAPGYWKAHLPVDPGFERLDVLLVRLPIPEELNGTLAVVAIDSVTREPVAPNLVLAWDADRAPPGVDPWLQLAPGHRAVFEGMPRGRMHVQVVAPGYRSAGARGVEPQRERDPAPVVVELQPLDRWVHGRIRDPETGADLTSVSIRRLPDPDEAIPGDRWLAEATQLGGSGPAGFRVRVSSRERVLEFSRADRRTVRAAIPGGDTPMEVALPLRPGGRPPLLITGVIVDADAGTPVEGARWTLRLVIPDDDPMTLASGSGARVAVRPSTLISTELVIEADGYTTATFDPVLGEGQRFELRRAR